ncbi:MAG: glycosyltransferase family 39 protein [Gemmataceae bacterium]|nr:glycosyltransferase family 39 protein [Gemmataceae bacterium]
MATRLHRRVCHYLLLLAAGACLFFWNLGGASLWDIDEGKNATCAAEMMASGNYVVPTFSGDLRVDKPALLYWLQIAAYHAFGINEFAARLPSALAALGALLLAYELGRALFGKTTGLLTGLIAASTPMLTGAARFANPDALLHFFSLLTLVIVWLGHRQPSRWWWLGLGAATGFGMLAKGPVGVVLPAAVAVMFLAWEGRFRTLADRRFAWAALAWCLVALPWYIWVAVDTKGNFLRGFFLQHNVGRFGSAMENHGGSPLYYPMVLLVGMAPWSVFLGGALWCGFWSALRKPSEISQGRLDRWRRWAADDEQVGHPEVKPAPVSAYRFLLCWIAAYLVFFTLAATKLPNYVLPVVVPAAILTARLLDRWRRGLLVAPDWVWTTAFACLLLIGAGFIAGLAVAGGVGELAVMRGRFVPGLAAWAWLGVLPLGGVLLAWRFWARGRRHAVLTCLTLSAVTLVAPLAAWGSITFNHVKAPRRLAELAGAARRPDDIRIGAWRLEHLPSLNFYLRRDVTYLRNEAELRGLLRYPLPVYVFLPAPAWQQCRPATQALGREVARHRDLYRQADVVVVTNQ